ncbi:MAG: ribosome silencing factor [Clostridia bacterium]|nr:ribosome silencing factor [Clostridia bacterium]
MTSLEKAKNIAKILDSKKAENINVIKTKELTVVADYFVVAGGTSSTHVRALAGEVEDSMKALGVEPDHIEGRATGWILLDYGSVLVHVFDPQSREYYNIERLWNDAESIDISDILTEN